MHRFPYLLQTDENFEQTLLNHRWQKFSSTEAGKWRLPDRLLSGADVSDRASENDCLACLTTSQLRGLLCCNPALLYAYRNPHDEESLPLCECDLLDAIMIPAEYALAESPRPKRENVREAESVSPIATVSAHEDDDSVIDSFHSALGPSLSKAYESADKAIAALVSQKRKHRTQSPPNSAHDSQSSDQSFDSSSTTSSLPNSRIDLKPPPTILNAKRPIGTQSLQAQQQQKGKVSPLAANSNKLSLVGSSTSVDSSTSSVYTPEQKYYDIAFNVYSVFDQFKENPTRGYIFATIWKLLTPHWKSYLQVTGCPAKNTDRTIYIPPWSLSQRAGCNGFFNTDGLTYNLDFFVDKANVLMYVYRELVMNAYQHSEAEFNKNRNILLGDIRRRSLPAVQPLPGTDDELLNNKNENIENEGENARSKRIRRHVPNADAAIKTEGASNENAFIPFLLEQKKRDDEAKAEETLRREQEALELKKQDKNNKRKAAAVHDRVVDIDQEAERNATLNMQNEVVDPEVDDKSFDMDIEKLSDIDTIFYNWVTTEGSQFTLFSRLFECLKRKGWSRRECVQSKSDVFVAPWACDSPKGRDKYDYSSKTLNVDYFVEKDMLMKYVYRNGNNRITNEKKTVSPMPLVDATRTTRVSVVSFETALLNFDFDKFQLRQRKKRDDRQKKLLIVNGNQPIRSTSQSNAAARIRALAVLPSSSSSSSTTKSNTTAKEAVTTHIEKQAAAITDNFTIKTKSPRKSLPGTENLHHGDIYDGSYYSSRYFEDPGLSSPSSADARIDYAPDFDLQHNGKYPDKLDDEISFADDDSIVDELRKSLKISACSETTNGNDSITTKRINRRENRIVPPPEESTRFATVWNHLYTKKGFKWCKVNKRTMVVEAGDNDQYAMMAPGKSINDNVLRKNEDYFLTEEALLKFCCIKYGLISDCVHKNEEQRSVKQARIEVMAVREKKTKSRALPAVSPVLGTPDSHASDLSAARKGARPNVRNTKSIVKDKTESSSSLLPTAAVTKELTLNDNKKVATTSQNEITSLSFSSSSSSSSSVAEPRTLEEAIKKCKSMLFPSAEPAESVPMRREAEFEIVSREMSKSITGDCGTYIYLCGISGAGKTVMVHKVIAQMERQYQDKTDAFQKVFVQGTTMDKDFGYLDIAAQLNIIPNDDISSSSACTAARNAVLRRFKSPCHANRAKKRLPLTILFIDEIDQAPADEIRILANISRGQNSSLILIGAGNNVSFAHDLRTVEMPQMVVFKEYSKDDLVKIFSSRNYCGLFNQFGLDFIARKLLGRVSGDARIGIAIMQQCLETAIQRGADMGVIEWKG